MAIIKCPECGHDVSDKAPFCPNCGVRIEGNPDVQRSLSSTASQQSVAPKPTPASAGNQLPPKTPGNHAGSKQPKKNNAKIWIISLIAILVACCTVFYFYNSANNNKEEQAYNYAMQSTDPNVLQSYLDTYLDADPAHRDSIQAHLAMLKQGDQDWTNALISGSKTALEEYLQKHPNSTHKQEAWNKIDSIDWSTAKDENTIESYQEYLNAHADGAHIDEAEDAIKKVKAKDLQPEEKQMITGLFRRFFQSVNSRNDGGLTATCEDVMSSFLGKRSATHSDVSSFLDKIYKDDITNMNWHINNDYKIKKREVGEDEYEYNVNFSAVCETEHTDPANNGKNDFKINATVSPDGKISAFNMIRVIE